MRSPYISLSGSVRHRKEYFGGILFHTGTGTMIDVDREAYALILLLEKVGVADVNELDVLWSNAYGKHPHRFTAIRIVKKLLALQILAVMPQGILKKDYSFDQDNRLRITWPSTPDLSAPETVHWAVTFKCDAACPDCYVRRHKHKFAAELETKHALEMIDKIAEAGVFQLAIGGGEPFLRADLATLVARARERNLVVHLTTGRYQHESGVFSRTAKYIKCLQIGIKPGMLEHPENEREKLRRVIYLSGEQGIDVGANLILSRSTIGEFEQIVESLSAAGFKRITLLRYKPPGDVNRWRKENPDRDTLLAFERMLAKTVDTYPHIRFRVDCGLAFLERNLPSQKAAHFGIRGCTAADRILSMAPDGSLFPCSQLVGDEFSAGNLLTDNFESIWTNSKILRKYRNFRKSKSFKNSHCGRCAAKVHCGGCRVFAADARGADPGCPNPLLSLPERQKYHNYPADLILSIQESIGYTEAGFPYATTEEIAGWLEAEENYGYPEWLIKNNQRRDPD
jgi:radical SAM protein with 4Fe4S-binding SPASM domain